MIDVDKEIHFFEKLGSEIDDILFLAKGLLDLTLFLIGHLIYSAYYYTVGKWVNIALYHRNRRAAARANAQAQSDLGLMYSKGLGVAQNDAEAVRWYRKAADQGFAHGQCNLAFMYLNGRGVPQDFAEAIRWYRKAAEQEFAAAQNNLGAMYNDGNGVSQDEAEATRWYRKAAEQGLALAQNNLGLCYEQGRGVPQDYVEAQMWLILAASRASGDDRKKIKMGRDALAEKMTAEQVAQAQGRARDWKPKKTP